MEGKMTIKDPNSVEVSLTITMTLSRWKDFKDQLDKVVAYEYPSSELKNMIRDLIWNLQKDVLVEFPEK